MENSTKAKAPRKTRLTLAKITPKQTKLMGELLVYFNGRRLRAKRYNDKYGVSPVESIPLSKIYKHFKCNSKDKIAVKIAAGVFFKQKYRGNSLTGLCSGWELRQKPHLNGQVIKALHELWAENSEHIQSVRTYLNTPDEKMNTVTMTTEFKFQSAEQAATFAELMQQLEIDEEEEE